MDEDYQDNSGLGNFAWFKIGEWAAEDAQRTRNLCANLGGYGPVPREDYNHAIARHDHAVRLNQGLGEQNDRLHAESHAFKAENSKLRQAVQKWETDYAALRAYLADREKLLVDYQKACHSYAADLDETRQDLEEANLALREVRRNSTPD